MLNKYIGGIMNKISIIIISSIFSLSFLGYSVAQSLEDNIVNKAIGVTNNFIGSKVSAFSESLKSFDRIKYLDLDVQVQDSLKPTIGLTNVNSLYEGKNSAFFNQNSLSFHDEDQTINIGLGYRTLMNDDKLMLGGNLFFDYAFDEAHQRNGVGVEAISSVFDLRGNYYDASSGIKTVAINSTEEALDGWDARLDYHLPTSKDIRVFAGIFEFENTAGSYELKGEKYGLDARLGMTNIEAGYVDDNKQGDGAFVNVRIVIPLNNDIKKHTQRAALEYVSVRDQLFTPVKRENKIRIVKISPANVIVSGF